MIKCTNGSSLNTLGCMFIFCSFFTGDWIHFKVWDMYACPRTWNSTKMGNPLILFPRSVCARRKFLIKFNCPLVLWSVNVVIMILDSCQLAHFKAKYSVVWPPKLAFFIFIFQASMSQSWCQTHKLFYPHRLWVTSQPSLADNDFRVPQPPPFIGQSVQLLSPAGPTH